VKHKIQERVTAMVFSIHNLFLNNQGCAGEVKNVAKYHRLTSNAGALLTVWRIFGALLTVWRIVLSPVSTHSCAFDRRPLR
jgi:hypothetical protein